MSLMPLLLAASLAQASERSAEVAPLATQAVPVLSPAPIALSRGFEPAASAQAPEASVTAPAAAVVQGAAAGWQARRFAAARRIKAETRPWAPLRYDDPEQDEDDGEPGQGWNRGPVTQSVDDSLDALKMQLMHPVNRLYPAVLHPSQPSAEELSWELNDILAEQKERVPERDLVPRRLRDKTMAFLDAVGMTIGVQDDEETLDAYRARMISHLDRASSAIRESASEAELDKALYGEAASKPEQPATPAPKKRVFLPLAAFVSTVVAFSSMGGYVGYPTIGYAVGVVAGLWLALGLRSV